MSSLLAPAPNDGSVHKGVQYTSSLVMPRPGAALNVITAHNGYSRRGRVRRVVTNVVLMLSMLVLLVAGIAIPAQANPFTDGLTETFCGADARGNTPAPDALGAMGLRPQGLPQDLAQFSSQPRTAFEKYGMSGTNFSIYRGDMQAEEGSPLAADEGNCVINSAEFTNEVANSLFGATKFVTAVGIWLYESSGSVSALIDTHILPQIEALIEGGNGRDGLRDVLYLEFLGVVLMVSALWLGYHGLVKRAVTRAGGGFAWTIGAVVIGSLLMFNPTIVVRSANGVTGAVTSAISTTVSAAGTGTVGTNNICYVTGSSVNGSGGSFGGLGRQPGISASTRMASCSMWSTFVYTPWVIGQFGAAPGDRRLTAGDDIPVVDLGGDKRVTHWALAQVEAQSIDYRMQGSADTLPALAKKTEIFDTVTRHANTDATLRGAWRGLDNANRVTVSASSLAAAIAGSGLVLFLAGAVLFYQVVLMILALFSPFFLLMAVHPGVGRKVAGMFASSVAATVIKQVVVATLLALYMLFAVSVMQMNAPGDGAAWFVSIVFLVILSVAMLRFRKPLERMMTPNWGDASLPPGHAGRPTSTATGGLTGGAAAALGLMGGAVSGNAVGGMTAVRTIGKGAVSGAQRGSYGGGARSGAARGLGAGLGASSSATNAVRTRKTAEAEQRKSDARVEAHQNDPHVYAQQKEKVERETVAEQREYDRHYGNDDGYTKRFNDKYQDAAPTWLRERRERQAQHAQDVADWRRHGHDPAYRAKVEARYGGIPAHLQGIEPDPAPRPQSATPRDDAPAGDDSRSTQQPGATGSPDSSDDTGQPGTSSAPRTGAEDRGSGASQRPAQPRSGQPRRPAGSTMPRPTQQGGDEPWQCRLPPSQPSGLPPRLSL